MHFVWPLNYLNDHRLDEIDEAVRHNEEVSVQTCIAVKKSNGEIPEAVFGPKPKLQSVK